METPPNRLDKALWSLFRTQTMGRAVFTMALAIVFGYVMVAVLALMYYFDSPESRFDPLFFLFFFLFVLAQLVAGVSRLIYDSQKRLARLLQLLAILNVVACAVLLAVILTF